MTGAQALIESLKRENVTQIFGHAGATLCPIADSLMNEDMNFTLVRFEQGAGHMASGYARASGKVGVCMVAAGPGDTNLITGIATAYMDNIPMVAVTGQVPSKNLGHDVFQEFDITTAAAPFVKHSYLVKDAGEIPRIVKEAFYIASTGRPGPVLIDLPIDVQNQEVDFVWPETVHLRGYQPVLRADDLQIKAATAAIREAKRPVICAGGGVFSAGAEKELEALSQATRIPVVTTMMGLGLLPTNHEMHIGMIGAQGSKTANYALSHNDLVLLIGARAADRAIPNAPEIAKRTKFIHFDVDPAEIGKNIAGSIPVIGDLKTVLSQVLAERPKAADEAWLSELQEKRDRETIKNTVTRTGCVTPRFLMQELGKRLDDDAYVCVDVGQNQIWAARELPVKNGRFLTTGGFGTMGYAFPAAIGVKTALPEKQTVVIAGDGGFQMSMNELATMVDTGADIKIVLLQNNALGLVCELQKARYGGRYASDFGCMPDFEKIAGAYGIACGTVSDDGQIGAAVDAMLKSPGPYLLICMISPDATTAD